MKPNLGEIIADKYRLDRVLGTGGMSTVYAAANVTTGKPVAIKLLLPELMRGEEQSQRLLREAQAASAIDHPNVVNVFDIGSHEGSLFLVMELLHGEPLSALLQRGAQDPCEFVRLMMPVLRGVHAAHRVGVVHRDLKPDNIFLCCDPHGELREPKVLDFGISKITKDGLEPGRELTRDGTVFGTPQYMAPEQMRDAHATDLRSDVYALGVIFYRAFSHAYPYDADTLTALAIRIVEGNAAPLHELCPGLDRELSDVVMHALTLDPEGRFPSVAAFGMALEPYANGVMFTPGLGDRESLLPRRDSSQPARESANPAPARDSASSSLGRAAARRPLAPPPPPRVSFAASHAAEKLTRALDAGDLMAAVELIEPRREPKLSVPPPPFARAPEGALRPGPSYARPSRGLEIIVDDPYTQRLDGGSRRQSWVLSASLVVIGLLAPAGWQQWQKARGLASVPAPHQTQGAFMGKTANVYAAQALRPENSVASSPIGPHVADPGAADAEPRAPIATTGVGQAIASPIIRAEPAPLSVTEPAPALQVAKDGAPKAALKARSARSKEELARSKRALGRASEELKAPLLTASPVVTPEQAPQPAQAEPVTDVADETEGAPVAPVAADEPN